jgi:hypothetical protein
VKTTRKIISFEIETSLPAAAFKRATIRVPCTGTRWEKHVVMKYLNAPQINTIRASTAARKKAGRG